MRDRDTMEQDRVPIEGLGRALGRQARFVRRTLVTSPIVAAVQAAERGELDRTNAVLAVAPDEVEDLLHAKDGRRPAGTGGRPRGGRFAGGGVGPGVFDGGRGAGPPTTRASPPCLCGRSPRRPDEVAMSAAAAIITAKGGMASHAAVIARGWGIPAVVGVETLAVDVAAGAARLGDVEMRDGDPITVGRVGGHDHAGRRRGGRRGDPRRAVHAAGVGRRATGRAVGGAGPTR